jgi:hypothetical protein
MKRFMLYITVFIIPIIAAGICSEILLRKIPNDYKYKSDYLDHKSFKTKVLVLGSSHSFYGVDPKYFSLPGFNAADVAQSLEYDFSIFEKFQSRMKDLKFLVLPVDYFSLYFDWDETAESWRVKNYEIYYKIHFSDKFEDRTEVLSSKLDVNSNRLYDYYIKGISNLTCSNLGWGTAYKSKEGRNLDSTGVIAAKRHSAQLLTTSFKFHLNTLTKIIKLAEAKGVKVILYTSPAYKSYVDHLNKKQLFNTIEVLNILPTKYSNVTYVNWLTDQSFTAKDFFDADHFNEFGAQKFSYKVDSAIRMTAKNVH